MMYIQQRESVMVVWMSKRMLMKTGSSDNEFVLMWACLADCVYIHGSAAYPVLPVVKHTPLDVIW